MIAIAAFTAEELVSKQEIFEHLALRFEKEAILELDDIERDVGIKNVSVCACFGVSWVAVEMTTGYARRAGMTVLLVWLRHCQSRGRLLCNRS